MDFKYPIEGRHSSWFTNEALNYLSEKNICLVWNEVQGVTNPAKITSDYVYLRLIGDRSIPDSKFGKVRKNHPELISSWAERLKKVQDNAKLALVMANNPLEGFAPSIANSLRLQLGMKSLLWYEKKQKTLAEF